MSVTASATTGTSVITKGDLAVSLFGGEVDEYTPAGTFVQTLVDGSNGLGAPTGSAFDGSGNLYVTDFTNNQILKRDALTGTVTVFASNSTVGNGQKFNSPESIVFNRGYSQMYVSGANRFGSGGGINIIDMATGTGAGFYPLPSSSGGSGESDWLAFDANSNLFMTNENPAQGVMQVDPGTGDVILPSFAPNLPNYGYALSFDKSGNVWVGDTDRILEFDSSGTLVRTITNSSFSLIFAAVFNPTGDQFYAGDISSGAVYAYDISGTLQGSFNTGGEVSGLAVAGAAVPPNSSANTVLFIQGIGSTSTCQDSPDFVGRVSWLRSGLSSAVPSSSFLYYGYRSPNTSNPTCSDSTIPQYSKPDTCWSLDDAYSQLFFRTRQVPGGGQATRLASYLRSYLDAHPGVALSIVTHSQGGVLATYTVKEKLSSAYAARIRAIVTLDSPLRGINGAFRGALTDFAGCNDPHKGFDSAYDMDPTSAVIRRINDSSQPPTRLYTIDANPGTLCSTCRYSLVDDAHSTTWWAEAHIQVSAQTHSNIWDGCFTESTGTVCAGAGGLNLQSQGRKLIRFAGCAVGNLAPDCKTYSSR